MLMMIHAASHPAPPGGPPACLLRRCAWLLGLAACCGCQLIGHERPVPKQVAASRQLSQRGISELDRGDWDSGEKSLARSIELCGVDPESRRHYAEALWHRAAVAEAKGDAAEAQKERAKALAQMQEALRLSGEDAGLAVRTGEMLLEMARPAEAGRMADEAVSIDPRLGSAWLLRGQVASSQGRLDDALAQLQRALQYQHDDKRALLFTAELYRQLGRPERALNTLETLRDGYAPGEEPQRVLYLQGLAFSALGRYDDAVETYTLALQRDRPSAELYDRLAEAHLLAGRTREAADAVAKALALEPNRGPSRELATRIDLAQRSLVATRRE